MSRATRAPTADPAGDVRDRVAGWLAPEPRPWPARLLAMAAALVVMAPVLRPGYVLLLDMVVVPRQDLDLDALGLGSSLPRAVPADAVMAVLTHLVPGQVVQKAALLAIVYTAVLGAARLVPPGPDGSRGAAGAVAGLVYGWSPFLAERLLLGHWTLLLGYAALPWVARTALDVRAGRPRALPRLVLTAAPAALTPTGAVLALGVVLAVVGARRLLPAGGAVALLALPWVVAGLLHPAGAGSDPAGVAAFAARGENWAGPVVAVLGTGGVWNGAAAPASRASGAVPLVTLLLVGAAVLGWCTAGRQRAAARGLLLLGGVGLLLALAGALPGTAQLLEAAVTGVPGAGLLRDGQKWVAWWALPLAVGAGLGVRSLTGAVRRRAGPAGAAAVVICGLLLPVAVLPDLAWGVGGRLQPVDYPAAWSRVREALARDTRPGDVLALPFGPYRAFAWNGDRTLLDPAARWLPRPVVADDTLVVGGVRVAGEDPRARAAGADLDDPRALARLGIGWVLVEHGTPGRPVPGELAALPVVVDSAELTLHRVPGAAAGPAPAPERVTAVVGAHLAAAGAVVISALWIAGAASTVTRRRRPLRKRIAE